MNATQPESTAQLTLRLSALAAPMLGEQIFNFLIGFYDTYLAGTISREVTAAVGTGAYFGWFLTLGFAVVTTGVGALISRAIGARDLPWANRVLRQGVVISLLIGALLSVVVFQNANAIAGAFSQTSSARGFSRLFLKIDAWGYVFASVTFVATAALRAAGNARAPLILMACVAVLNAVASTALVQGWFDVPLGVEGIALGTLFARVCGAAGAMSLLLIGQRGIRLSLLGSWFDREAVVRLLRVGLPAGGEAAFLFAAQLSFIWLVARSATGDAATTNFAAHMIAIRLEAISFLPAVAWMTAAAALAGQSIGAGEPQRAERIGHLAAMLGAASCAVVGGSMFFFSPIIYEHMTRDAGVREIGARVLPFMGLMQPVLGAGLIYAGTLRGVGDTRATMLISLICSVGLRVPLAAIGIHTVGGLLGAWMGMFADNTCRALLSALRFRQGAWKRLRV